MVQNKNAFVSIYLYLLSKHDSSMKFMKQRLLVGCVIEIFLQKQKQKIEIIVEIQKKKSNHCYIHL